MLMVHFSDTVLYVHWYAVAAAALHLCAFIHTQQRHVLLRRQLLLQSVAPAHSLQVSGTSVGDCTTRPVWEKKLLQLFALAQSIGDAEALSGYLSAVGTAAAAASPEQQHYQQRLEACRIVASLHDADAVALHNLALKVVKEADTQR